MTTPPNYTELFNRFAGREVAVIENLRKVGNYGQATQLEVNLAPNDPVIAELKQEAKAAGLQLRVFLPGECGSADYNEKRLNAFVQKDPDSKYRIKAMGLG